ncbi:MAG TPA: glycosyltransferase family 2 protein [Cytophagaceae bacterium]|jgi:glycosyltransferase involved in cell wall biosynthesis|nr:glycosyltransferase family 2 protein [Cytophagaceae bacterium]
MRKSIKISVVIITFNEERNIKRCLDSVKEIADEIIVLDSFSTDNTEKICQEYQVQFFKQTWLGYSKQKNVANSLAQYDYILSMDADECLSDELLSSIKKIKNNPEYDVYIVKRLTNYCGQWIRHGGWYPDRKIRIWKRDAAKWQGEIHETLKLESGLSCCTLEGDLYHYSYYKIEDHVKKANLFTNIMALEAIKNGRISTMVDIFFSPGYKFFKIYFLKLGFLDGFAGFLIASISAQTAFYKHIKIREMNRKSKKNVKESIIKAKEWEVAA